MLKNVILQTTLNIVGVLKLHSSQLVTTAWSQLVNLEIVDTVRVWYEQKITMATSTGEVQLMLKPLTFLCISDVKLCFW